MLLCLRRNASDRDGAIVVSSLSPYDIGNFNGLPIPHTWGI